MDRGKETWVNLRGNLGDCPFERKCNDPNGLSLDLMHIQRLMSYWLDDPGSVANTVFDILPRIRTEGQPGQTQHFFVLNLRKKFRLCSVCSDQLDREL
jgi:hypothetical protein